MLAINGRKMRELNLVHLHKSLYVYIVSLTSDSCPYC